MKSGGVSLEFYMFPCDWTLTLLKDIKNIDHLSLSAKRHTKAIINNSNNTLYLLFALYLVNYIHTWKRKNIYIYIYLYLITEIILRFSSQFSRI